MPEYSPHQRKIIDRYYEHKDVILLTRLQEIASELYLADTPGKQNALWKRAEQAMNGLKIPASIRDHLLAERRPELLAHHIREWTKKS